MRKENLRKDNIYLIRHKLEEVFEFKEWRSLNTENKSLFLFENRMFELKHASCYIDELASSEPTKPTTPNESVVNFWKNFYRPEINTQ